MSWERVKLGDISSGIQTGPFGSQLHQSDYTEDGTPVVMPKDLIGGKISEQSIARVGAEHVQQLRRHVIQNGDILYSRRGDVGRCAFATEREAGWLCGTGCLRVTVNPRVADKKFVFYQLQQSSTIGWVEKHAVGATMLNLNTAILSNIPVFLPPIETQHRIADILSAYDDLIENNRKQIKLLEEAAQRLYKEWFVDLRFPGYEHAKITDGVPEGWDYVPFGKIVSYEIGGGWGEDCVTGKNECPGFVIRGTDIDGIKQGNLLSIPYRFHSQGNLAARELLNGDIIFEVSGGSKNTGVAKTLLITKSLLDVWQKPVMCASFCKLIRFNRPQIVQYIYDCLQYWRAVGETQEYEKKSASSIINYRWKDFLEQKCILLPEEHLLQKYCTMSSSLYKQAVTHSIAICKAMQARDCLLPKLMSGEVEV